MHDLCFMFSDLFVIVGERNNGKTEHESGSHVEACHRLGRVEQKEHRLGSEIGAASDFDRGL